MGLRTGKGGGDTGHNKTYAKHTAPTNATNRRRENLHGAAVARGPSALGPPVATCLRRLDTCPGFFPFFETDPPLLVLAREPAAATADGAAVLDRGCGVRHVVSGDGCVSPHTAATSSANRMENPSDGRYKVRSAIRKATLKMACTTTTKKRRKATGKMQNIRKKKQKEATNRSQRRRQSFRRARATQHARVTQAETGR